jgi:hypothetical protein
MELMVLLYVSGVLCFPGCAACKKILKHWKFLRLGLGQN